MEDCRSFGQSGESQKIVSESSSLSWNKYWGSPSSDVTTALIVHSEKWFDTMYQWPAMSDSLKCLPKLFLFIKIDLNLDIYKKKLVK
jgi:hypothetical protein